VPLTNTANLNSFLENKEIESLKKLAVPVYRNQNHSITFRSALMLSAHNLKHLRKIPTLNAECIILNLEDGVSAEQKPYALTLCALALSSYPQCHKKLVVRVNPLNEGGIEEIRYLNPFMPDAIRIPKIRSVEDVRLALDLIDQGIEVHLSIETKEAWLHLSEFAIDSRIKAYYLGVLDLFADLGLSQSLLTPDNPAVHYLLSEFLITSRACGVKPVSFVYQDYKNSDGLNSWLKMEKIMGFDAKGCISPRQAEQIHGVFGYSESDIACAEDIIRLFEDQSRNGVTGFVNEKYGFIDEPIYKDALNVVGSLV
jgi:citrate lyase subunit beta/citryl-CoA lyase